MKLLVTRVATLALVLALVGCSSSNRAPAKADSESPAAEPAAAEPAPEPAKPKGPVGAAGLLLPPGQHGGSVVKLAGCAKSGTRGEADAKSFPVPPAGSRGPATAAVTVQSTGNGIVVKHQLAHMCCRTAAVAATVEGTTVRVRETLEGPGCRCNCASTVAVAVGLSPGAYTLVVETDRAGDVAVAHEQPVTVQTLGRPSSPSP